MLEKSGEEENLTLDVHTNDKHEISSEYENEYLIKIEKNNGDNDDDDYDDEFTGRTRRSSCCVFSLQKMHAMKTSDSSINFDNYSRRSFVIPEDEEINEDSLDEEIRINLQDNGVIDDDNLYVQLEPKQNGKFKDRMNEIIQEYVLNARNNVQTGKNTKDITVMEVIDEDYQDSLGYFQQHEINDINDEDRNVAHHLRASSHILQQFLETLELMGMDGSSVYTRHKSDDNVRIVCFLLFLRDMEKYLLSRLTNLYATTETSNDDNRNQRRYSSTTLQRNMKSLTDVISAERAAEIGVWYHDFIYHIKSSCPYGRDRLSIRWMNDMNLLSEYYIESYIRQHVKLLYENWIEDLSTPEKTTEVVTTNDDDDDDDQNHVMKSHWPEEITKFINHELNIMRGHFPRKCMTDILEVCCDELSNFLVPMRELLSNYQSRTQLSLPTYCSVINDSGRISRILGSVHEDFFLSHSFSISIRSSSSSSSSSSSAATDILENTDSNDRSAVSSSGDARRLKYVTASAMASDDANTTARIGTEGNNAASDVLRANSGNRNFNYMKWNRVQKKAKKLERDFDDFSFETVQYLCQSLLFSSENTKDDNDLQDIGSPKWESGSTGVIRNLICSCQQHLRNIEVWLADKDYFPKVFFECIQLTVQTYVQSFYINTATDGIQSPDDVSQQFQKDYYDLVVFFNDPMFQKYYNASVIVSEGDVNTILSIVLSMSRLMNPSLAPADLTDDARVLLESIEPITSSGERNTSALLHIAGLRNLKQREESALDWMRIIGQVGQELSDRPPTKPNCATGRKRLLKPQVTNNVDDDSNKKFQIKLPNLRDSPYIITNMNSNDLQREINDRKRSQQLPWQSKQKQSSNFFNNFPSLGNVAIPDISKLKDSLGNVAIPDIGKLQDAIYNGSKNKSDRFSDDKDESGPFFLFRKDSDRVQVKDDTKGKKLFSLDGILKSARSQN